MDLVRNSKRTSRCWIDDSAMKCKTITSPSRLVPSKLQRHVFLRYPFLSLLSPHCELTKQDLVCALYHMSEELVLPKVAEKSYAWKVAHQLVRILDHFYSVDTLVLWKCFTFQMSNFIVPLQSDSYVSLPCLILLSFLFAFSMLGTLHMTVIGTSFYGDHFPTGFAKESPCRHS